MGVQLASLLPSARHCRPCASHSSSSKTCLSSELASKFPRHLLTDLGSSLRSKLCSGISQDGHSCCNSRLLCCLDRLLDGHHLTSLLQHPLLPQRPGQPGLAP